ncbi:hypothetical protein D9756_005441 [Leucocoprinus leucothites]|uniref:Exonuclease domain-containing protein n=1 Tax=Leucocoprinus leucothites TaxID=201217 RepID=A0A8H5D9Q0_9AGAR|nr:hypothetical protein D9756_005441 [Leucoagaricus leucothites]
MCKKLFACACNRLHWNTITGVISENPGPKALQRMRFPLSILYRSLRFQSRSYSYNNNRFRPLRYEMSVKPLDFYAGPLVWIDCEMTGLDPRKDKILEIAVLITNGNLELVDDGIQYIIKTEKEVLDGMDGWCTNQHGQVFSETFYAFPSVTNFKNTSLASRKPALNPLTHENMLLPKF